MLQWEFMTTKSTKAKAGVKARTLLIQMKDDEYRVTIPPGARVTFGPTIPYQKKNEGYSSERHDGYSLRVYESAKNDSLIAVFSGVSSFRDISMPHAKLIVREAGKQVWKSDEEGYKVETEVRAEKSFEEFKLLDK
jgi:hypothetical protein